MAQYTDGTRTYDLPDGQPDFPTWVAADAARQTAWTAAANEFFQYHKANGVKPTGSACDSIFQQWMTAVNAVEVK
jgi:hypothetical protein